MIYITNKEKLMNGKLYVCATPIGNLKDITIRCLEVLESVDIVASEDTRHTIKLLNHYNIKARLESYHKYNQKEKGEKLLKFLKDGKDIALVSDAGMPSISDPGEELINLCHRENIFVTVLPGACASITALVLSGMKARSYCFEGFLPTVKKFQNNIFEKMKNDDRTYVFYEAPHHLLKTLNIFYEQIGNRDIAVLKELTKKHEAFIKDKISNVIAFFEQNQPKGEYVIVIDGVSEDDINKKKQEKINSITIKSHIDIYTKKGVDIKDAMKIVAKERGISKREIYSEIKIKNNK